MSCKLPDLPRGNTRTFTDTITVDGEAANITGHTVVLTLKKNPNDAAAALTITNTVHTTPLAGLTTFTITAAQSILFEEKTYYVDITWLRASPSEVHTVFSGTMDIIKPVRTPA